MPELISSSTRRAIVGMGATGRSVADSGEVVGFNSRSLIRVPRWLRILSCAVSYPM